VCSVVLCYCRRGLRMGVLSGVLFLYAWFEAGCAQCCFVTVGVV